MPDGFTSEFFRKIWPEMKADILHGVHQFFKGIPILRSTNHNFITLISKTPTVTEMGDFKPLSRVNIISHVFCELISLNQTAFIQGRHISDNTRLAEEMVYGFISIDLRKAFDTVRWEAIIATLEAFVFSPLFCRIIWNCISSASFSVLVEGSPTPPFKNCKGIRQGDPLSPILFDMVMDVLSRLIEDRVMEKRYDTCIVNGVISSSHLMYADGVLFT